MTHQPARASVLANVGFPLVFRPWMGLSVPGSAVPGATTSVSWPLPATLSFQLPIGYLGEALKRSREETEQAQRVLLESLRALGKA